MVGGVQGGIHFRFGLGDGRLLMVVAFFYKDYVMTATTSKASSTPLRRTTNFLVIPFRGKVTNIDSVFKGMGGGLHSGRSILRRGRRLGDRVGDLARRGGVLVRSRARLAHLGRLCSLSRRCASCPGITTEVVSGSPKG